eukprot:8438003-Pyramimonas_sp.AAC.1
MAESKRSGAGPKWDTNLQDIAPAHNALTNIPDDADLLLAEAARVPECEPSEDIIAAMARELRGGPEVAQ